MRRINKRGGITDHMSEIIIFGVGLLCTLWFIWTYFLHGGGDTVNAFQQCGAITGNKGECRETCDPILEAEFPDVGCKGSTNKCCIARNEDMGDVILPQWYGGNTEYDFTVESIAVTNKVINGCIADPVDAPDPREFICQPNQAIEVNVDIGIDNTQKQSVFVLADVVTVENDNGDSIAGPDRYRGTVAVEIPVKNKKTVTTTVRLTQSDTTKGSYIKIYPYGVCITDSCQRTDSRSRGVLNRNVDEFITLRFVS